MSDDETAKPFLTVEEGADRSTVVLPTRPILERGLPLIASLAVTV